VSLTVCVLRDVWMFVYATVGYFVYVEFFFFFHSIDLLVGQLLVLVSALLSCSQLKSLLCVSLDILSK